MPEYSLLFGQQTVCRLAGHGVGDVDELENSERGSRNSGGWVGGCARCHGYVQPRALAPQCEVVGAVAGWPLAGAHRPASADRPGADRSTVERDSGPDPLAPAVQRPFASASGAVLPSVTGSGKG